MDAAFAIPDHISPDRVVDFDIYADPRINEDIQGSYARVLADAPDVFWTPRNGGHWLVKRFEEISVVEKTPEIFSCREMQVPRIPEPTKFLPLSLDPPENIPYRQVLMPLFSPKAVQNLEPTIRAWAQELVAQVAPRGECDFAHDVAAVFPVSIFMTLMGMPRERLHEFRSMADQFFNARTPEDFEVAYPKINNVLTELIDERLKKPGDDLVSHFLAAELMGQNRKMTLDEVQRLTFLLFLGGMDTVTNVTAFTYQHLAERPELQERIAEHPEIIPDVVEEGLRMFGVVNAPRMVVKDCEKFGVQFRYGEMVVSMLCMGGRDDRVNSPDPNVFNIDRPNKQYLAFGTGPHLCVGHILARAEMRILGEEWFKAVPSFISAPGAKHRFRTGMVNALESLPLQWWG